MFITKQSATPRGQHGVMGPQPGQPPPHGGSSKKLAPNWAPSCPLGALTQPGSHPVTRNSDPWHTCVLASLCDVLMWEIHDQKSFGRERGHLWSVSARGRPSLGLSLRGSAGLAHKQPRDRADLGRGPGREGGRGAHISYFPWKSGSAPSQGALLKSRESLLPSPDLEASPISMPQAVLNLQPLKHIGETLEQSPVGLHYPALGGLLTQATKDSCWA